LRSGAQSVAEFLAELLGFSGGLEGSEEGEFGGRSELVGIGVQRERKLFHGGSGFYPRDEVLAADEDVRARPSKQAAAWPGAWQRWTQQLCPGGSASPLLEQCSKPYPICCFAKFSQKLNWSQTFTKMKVVQNFTSYKTSLSAQN